MMKKIHNSRGDTIVEVLIALGVLTTILVGAYVTANRSQNTTRASQERGEAIKVAEAQLEQLKGLLLDGKSFPVGKITCANSAGSDFVAAVTAPTNVNPFSQSLANATFPYSPSDCGNLDGRYNVAIQRNGNTFEILVRWNRIAGGKDQINMYYKVHPPNE